MTEKLLNVKEVCSLLGVTPNWVACHASGKSKPLLPSLKVGKYRRFHMADVDAYVALCEGMARNAALRKSRIAA